MGNHTCSTARLRAIASQLERLATSSQPAARKQALHDELVVEVVTAMTIHRPDENGTLRIHVNKKLAAGFQWPAMVGIINSELMRSGQLPPQSATRYELDIDAPRVCNWPSKNPTDEEMDQRCLDSAAVVYRMIEYRECAELVQEASRGVADTELPDNTIADIRRAVEDAQPEPDKFTTARYEIIDGGRALRFTTETNGRPDGEVVLGMDSKQGALLVALCGEWPEALDLNGIMFGVYRDDMEELRQLRSNDDTEAAWVFARKAGGRARSLVHDLRRRLVRGGIDPDVVSTPEALLDGDFVTSLSADECSTPITRTLSL